MIERAKQNLEKNRAIARLRAINYEIAYRSEYMKQPQIEKLLVEKEELQKVLKCHQ